MMKHFLIVISLVAFCITGCARPDTEEIVFAVGGAPTELDFWARLAGEFEADTHIPVRLLRLPADTDQQRQTLVVSLKARMSDPDVFLMDIAWLGLFREAGWLAPLDGVLDEKAFFQKVMDDADRFNGRLVALPVYMDAGMLYYRKDMVDAPPETWTSLIKTAQKTQARVREKNPDFYGFVWTGAQYEGLITVFMEMAGAAGGFVETHGKISLNTPANVDALNLMRRMIWTAGISPPNTFTEMKEENVRMAFQRGGRPFRAQLALRLVPASGPGITGQRKNRSITGTRP